MPLLTKIPVGRIKPWLATVTPTGGWSVVSNEYIWIRLFSVSAMYNLWFASSRKMSLGRQRLSESELHFDWWPATITPFISQILSNGIGQFVEMFFTGRTVVSRSNEFVFRPSPVRKNELQRLAASSQFLTRLYPMIWLRKGSVVNHTHHDLSNVTGLKWWFFFVLGSWMIPTRIHWTDYSASAHDSDSLTSLCSVQRSNGITINTTVHITHNEALVLRPKKDFFPVERSLRGW